jgi:hypothetical protein
MVGRRASSHLVEARQVGAAGGSGSMHTPATASRNILKHEAITFRTKTKRRELLVLPASEPLRVLDYPHTFLSANVA